jgi:pilus assembly protein Flp/PilA
LFDDFQLRAKSSKFPNLSSSSAADFTDALAGLRYKSLMRRMLIAFLKDKTAATAIEYGLIAAGIALAIIPVIAGLGTHLKTTFSAVSSALK